MMFLKRAVTCAAAGVSAVLLASCGGLFSEPAYTPVRTYDIGFPATELIRGASPLDVEPLSSDSPARYKMSFRRGTRIEQNEYRKWVQIPSSMLTTYFKQVFTAEFPAAYSLAGTLIAFEADPGQHLCRLYIDYTIREKASKAVVRSGILRIETPLPDTGDEGDAFASAMSKAAADAAKAFDKIIKSLPQQKVK